MPPRVASQKARLDWMHSNGFSARVTLTHGLQASSGLGKGLERGRFSEFSYLDIQDSEDFQVSRPAWGVAHLLLG